MMKDMEKLRVLLPHWIEHNRSHAAEFKKWCGIIQESGEPEIAALIEKAIADMGGVDEALSRALEKTGGPVEESGHHHHHH